MLKKLKQYTFVKLFWDIFIIVAGGCTFAVSVNVFFDPFQIAPGGVTGIALLVNTVVPILPIGTLVLILNVPLFFLSWKFLGHRFLLLSFFGTVVSSLAINYLNFIPVPTDLDPLLAALVGGVLCGAGLGLVFLRGATTGGSDIVARLLKVAFPHMQMGRLILFFDGLVVAASGIVFGSFKNAVYAAVALYVSTLTLDGLLYGTKTARVVYIISEKTREVTDAISRELQRGTTLLNAEGGYTHTPKQVILCAIKPQQIAILKEIVKQADPSAFIILTEAHEVLGEGFQDYDKNTL